MTLIRNIEDVDVIERASLDDAHAKQFRKPWLVQFTDGIIRQFDTEAEACAFQRAHRRRNGLNPLTGE